MATANRSGDDRRAQDASDTDPDRTQRIPALQTPVDDWFSDDNDEQSGGQR